MIEKYRPQVRELPHKIAAEFIERWHYSGRVPTGQNRFFGWFVKGAGSGNDLFGESLYAVADYGIGVNPYQASFLSRLVGKEIETEHLVELKRLCRVEPKISGLPLTAFIARCNRVLKKDGMKFVVSFSDPAYGHSGGIYRAANFKHYSQTGEEMHLMDQSGETRHRRYAFRHARRNGITVSEARDDLGLRRIKTPRKDRWGIEL